TIKIGKTDTRAQQYNLRANFVSVRKPELNLRKNLQAKIPEPRAGGEKKILILYSEFLQDYVCKKLIPMIIFETERLVVRRFSENDHDNFFSVNGSEEVMRYIRPAKTKEECDEFLLQVIAYSEK